MSKDMPTTRAVTNVVLAFMGGLVLLFPTWFFANSFWEAYHQHQMIRSFVQTDATVLSSQITTSSGRHETHYHAEVKYRYTVAEKSFVSDQLTAMPVWSTPDWADSIVAKYKTGTNCPAYYNPANPSEAILLRTHSFSPYFDMLEAAALLTGGIFFFSMMGREKTRPPIPSDGGWYEIPARFAERQRLFTAIACTFAWYGLGGIAAAHYFTELPSPHPTARVRLFVLFALFGLIPLGLLIRRMRINRNWGDARLLLKQAVTQAGRPLVLSISQTARQELKIRRIKARLECYGKKDKARQTLFEHTVINVKDRMVRPGETLELPGELDLPADLQPSGRCASGQYNWITWELQYELLGTSGPRYSVVFPIEVQGGGSAGPGEPAKLEPVSKSGAKADIRAIDPDSAGRVLTKGRTAFSLLFTLLLLAVQLSGMLLIASVFLILFPDNSGAKPWLNVPKEQAVMIFSAGLGIVVVTTIYGLMFPNLLFGSLLHAAAKRAIGRRRDAIVQPDHESVWVDIIPRTNWYRLMLENAADVGFIRVDAARREILFEGDRERYRVPAEAVISCEIEWMGYARNPNRPSSMFCLVVLRANGPGGIWEAPIMPRLYKRRATKNARIKAAEALQKQIKNILPKQV